MGLWKKKKKVAFRLIEKKYLSLQPQFDRDVAQLASAPRSGRGGRVFESPHPDVFCL
jgi:hypothetical protein